jgi:TRAP-type uncharacterized transport system substrate-binding protein
MPTELIGGESAPARLVIYSPAPVMNMLHELNRDLGRAINRCPGGLTATVIPVALPDSINAIGRLPEAERRHHLPIVTSVDLLPAIERTGPSWHAYDRANADLKLVAALYDIAFGVLAFDPAIASPADLRGKRIGAPPRPSSVRVLTEALLRDGWGLADEVELVDLPPAAVAVAAAAGRIQATSWNFLHKTPDGFVPLLPALLADGKAAWLGVDDPAIAAINRANPFRIDGVLVPAGDVRVAGAAVPIPASTLTLLSFKQGLAAWAGTEDRIVRALLHCLLDRGRDYTGLPANLGAMLDWPALGRALVHPAALRFFAERGIAIL